MPKLELASDEIAEKVKEIVEEFDLDAFANFKVFELDSQKQFVKISRAGLATEYFAKTDDCVLVFVNPKIWDRLEERQRYLLILNALNGLTYDDEKNKMKLEQPDLAISSGCYAKYGKELVDAAEIAAHALRQMKEEEKAAKEAKKAAEAEKKKIWVPS